MFRPSTHDGEPAAAQGASASRRHPPRGFLGLFGRSRKNGGDGQPELGGLDPDVAGAVRDLPTGLREQTLQHLHKGGKAKIMYQTFADDEHEADDDQALRKALDASLDPNMQAKPTTSPPDSVISFFKSCMMGYEHRIGGEFYACFGVFPECADPGEVPLLPDLRLCKPVDSLNREVIQVDMTTDQALHKLRSDVRRNYGHYTRPLHAATAVATMVAERLGGRQSEHNLAAKHRQHTFFKQMSNGSVILQLGQLSTGLTGHRALLVKLVLEWLGIESAIVTSAGGHLPESSADHEFKLIIRDRDPDFKEVDIQLMERVGEYYRFHGSTGSAPRPIEFAYGGPVGAVAGFVAPQPLQGHHRHRSSHASMGSLVGASGPSEQSIPVGLQKGQLGAGMGMGGMPGGPRDRGMLEPHHGWYGVHGGLPVPMYDADGPELFGELPPGMGPPRPPSSARGSTSGDASLFPWMPTPLTAHSYQDSPTALGGLAQTPVSTASELGTPFSGTAPVPARPISPEFFQNCTTNPFYPVAESRGGGLYPGFGPDPDLTWPFNDAMNLNSSFQEPPSRDRRGPLAHAPQIPAHMHLGSDSLDSVSMMSSMHAPGAGAGVDRMLSSSSVQDYPIGAPQSPRPLDMAAVPSGAGSMPGGMHPRTAGKGRWVGSLSSGSGATVGPGPGPSMAADRRGRATEPSGAGPGAGPRDMTTSRTASPAFPRQASASSLRSQVGRNSDGHLVGRHGAPEVSLLAFDAVPPRSPAGTRHSARGQSRDVGAQGRSQALSSQYDSGPDAALLRSMDAAGSSGAQERPGELPALTISPAITQSDSQLADVSESNSVLMSAVASGSMAGEWEAGGSGAAHWRHVSQQQSMDAASEPSAAAASEQYSGGLRWRGSVVDSSEAGSQNPRSPSATYSGATDDADDAPPVMTPIRMHIPPSVPEAAPLPSPGQGLGKMSLLHSAFGDEDDDEDGDGAAIGQEAAGGLSLSFWQPDTQPHAGGGRVASGTLPVCTKPSLDPVAGSSGGSLTPPGPGKVTVLMSAFGDDGSSGSESGGLPSGVPRGPPGESPTAAQSPLATRDSEAAVPVAPTPLGPNRIPMSAFDSDTGELPTPGEPDGRAHGGPPSSESVRQVSISTSIPPAMPPPGPGPATGTGAGSPGGRHPPESPSAASPTSVHRTAATTQGSGPSLQLSSPIKSPHNPRDPAAAGPAPRRVPDTAAARDATPADGPSASAGAESAARAAAAADATLDSGPPTAEVSMVSNLSYAPEFVKSARVPPSDSSSNADSSPVLESPGPQGASMDLAADAPSGPVGMRLEDVLKLTVKDMTKRFHMWIRPEDIRLTNTVIGRGSYGQVHLGKFRTIKVAVKTILCDSDEEYRAAMQEMLLMQELQFAHVVRFFGAVKPKEDSALHPRNLMICMEYMPYSDLRRILHNCDHRKHVRFPERLLTLEFRLKWGKDIVSALDLLHSRNVVHRDLKPGNVLISHRFDAVLADFGLSRVRDAQQSRVQASGPGTVLYAAPEALRRNQVSPASDMFSFGCVLWELLSLKEPWTEVSGQQYPIMHAIINERKTLRVDDIPEDVQARVPEVIGALRKCFQYEPAQRLSADEMHAVLDHALENM